MLKEIIAAKAHIAEQGSKIRKFHMAASKLNTNPRFHPSVSGCTALDRFKTWMRVFILMRYADERASGVAYELSESERLLEKTKSQMDAVESPKHVEQKKEMEQ